MAVKLSDVKSELANVIDELEAAIQGVLGGKRGRSIAANSPKTMISDFPSDFPGEAGEIASLIDTKTSEFSEIVDEAKRSKEIPSKIVAVFQAQIGKLKRLQRYYRYIWKRKKLPGTMHWVLNQYNHQVIQGPFEKIKSKAKIGVI